MQNHVFCFGLGYVANHLKQSMPNFLFSGTHTGERVFQANEYLFKEDVFFDAKLLENVSHILISIPPSEQGDLVYLKLHEKLSHLPKLKSIIYISSTSVYGDHDGNWVNEESELKAFDKTGINRIKAEEQWLNSSLPVVVVRMAAIYGPERSFIDRLKKNEVLAIYKENHFFSRIHIDDITELLKCIIESNCKNEIFNFADDVPAPQHEVVQYARGILNLHPAQIIPYAQANLSKQMQQYYQSSKQISNAKIKKAFNIALKYPSYKEGLLSCL
jgi:nucleoside-diphosphate-sugar epimerase